MPIAGITPISEMTDTTALSAPRPAAARVNAIVGMSNDDLMAAFRGAHGDLLTAAWWRGMQDRLQAGEVIDLLPY